LPSSGGAVIGSGGQSGTAIGGNAATTGGTGQNIGGGAGADTMQTDSRDGGCACTVQGRRSSGGIWLAAAFVWLLRRRKLAVASRRCTGRM